MLQNRVDPFGQIISTSARGLWLGNRGVIHNDDKQIIKAFKHKAWIICALQFKGRKRMLMMPNRWTELFFLDEATAFAAGHRPCFECRKEDARRFKLSWVNGNASYGFTMKTSINEIDEIIHRERIDTEKKKVMHERPLSEIPDGTFILINDHPHLLYKAHFHKWSPFGYEESFPARDPSSLTVLTPNSIINAFSAGYIPQIKLPL
jgi:hypothetical protein